MAPHRVALRVGRRRADRAVGADALSSGALADPTRVELRGVPVLTVFGKRNDPFGFAPHWGELFPDVSS